MMSDLLLKQVEEIMMREYRFPHFYLDSFWMKMLRQCRNISLLDHVPNEETLKRFNTIPLSETIKQRRMKYLGHIVRYPSNLWVRKSIVSTRPDGPQTGKRHSWKKDIRKALQQKGANYSDCLHRGRWQLITKNQRVPCVPASCFAPCAQPQPNIRAEQRGRSRAARCRTRILLVGRTGARQARRGQPELGRRPGHREP